MLPAMNPQNAALPPGWTWWLAGLGATPKAQITEWARRFAVSERTARRWLASQSAPAHVVEAMQREIDSSPTPFEQALHALSFVEQVTRLADGKDEDFLRRSLRVCAAAVSSALQANGRRLHPTMTLSERRILESAVTLGGFRGADGLTTAGPSAAGPTFPHLGRQLASAPIALRAKQKPETETES